MSKSSAVREGGGGLTDTVKVMIEYHGKKYACTRRVTVAALLIDKYVLVKQAEEGAAKCMIDALKALKKKR